MWPSRPRVTSIAVSNPSSKSYRWSPSSMIDPPSSLLGTVGVIVVPDGLDVVAVEVMDERRVVPRPVVAPVARPAVVSASGRERRAMERLDLVLALRFERD